MDQGRQGRQAVLSQRRGAGALGRSHGQLTNYAHTARDCGVDAQTVKEHYQIIEDTLLGRRIFPFAKRARRRILRATPKFRLFDVGVATHPA